jgi:hypothetical protein
LCIPFLFKSFRNNEMQSWANQIWIYLINANHWERLRWYHNLTLRVIEILIIEDWMH